MDQLHPNTMMSVTGYRQSQLDHLIIHYSSALPPVVEGSSVQQNYEDAVLVTNKGL